jgi:hypothetical protein
MNGEKNKIWGLNSQTWQRILCLTFFQYHQESQGKSSKTQNENEDTKIWER